MIVLNVVGDPAPKGSNRAMLIGGRARFVPGGSRPNQAKLGSWKSAITDAASGRFSSYPSGPLAIGMIFRHRMRAADLDSRGGVRAKAPDFVVVKPDVDKLCRSTLDALTSAGVWSDDSQVVMMLAIKIYTPPGGATGATIVLGLVGHPVLENVTNRLDEDLEILRNARVDAAERKARK